MRLGGLEGLKGRWGVAAVRAGEEGGRVVVAGVVEVHGHGRGEELRVRDCVFVGGQGGVPGQAAAAEGGVPGGGGDGVEDVGAVGDGGEKLRAEPVGLLLSLVGFPGVLYRVGRWLVATGTVVVQGIVGVDQFDVFEPAENHPEHVVVRLIVERESVLAEVVCCCLAEIRVYECFSLLMMKVLQRRL